MKKVAIMVTLAVMTVAVVSSQAAKQRVPIKITGSGVTETNKFKLTNSSIVASNDSRLVLAVDFVNNTVDIEEWNATLSQKVQRNVSTNEEFKALVISSFRNARVFNVKSNKVTFATDLETGAPITRDWNRDGNDDTSADWQLLGTISLDSTGRVKKVSGKILGVMNDPVEGSGGLNSVLKKGSVKSTGPSF